jgi:hypothetical protein
MLAPASTDDATPTFVRPDHSHDSTNTRAPHRADTRRAPVGPVVWPAGALRVIEESKENSASDGAAHGTLGRARSTRHSATDVEAPHGNAWDLEGTRGAGNSQAKAAVDGFNRTAQYLSAGRLVQLASRLRNPDANSRSWLDLGRELRRCDAWSGENEGAND